MRRNNRHKKREPIWFPLFYPISGFPDDVVRSTLPSFIRDVSGPPSRSVARLRSSVMCRTSTRAEVFNNAFSRPLSIPTIVCMDIYPSAGRGIENNAILSSSWLMTACGTSMNSLPRSALSMALETTRRSDELSTFCDS